VAEIITDIIKEHKNKYENYFYVVGGDFNGEASLSNDGFGKYDIMRINFPYPLAEYGNDGNTNRSRTAKLDFILVDKNLYEYQISTDYCINENECKTYQNGLVFDSRDYSNQDLLKYFNGVESNYCDAKNMQHLAVIKDYKIEY
jgi:hypothetical protein